MGELKNTVELNNKIEDTRQIDEERIIREFTQLKTHKTIRKMQNT